MTKTVILPSYYFGTIQAFSHLIHAHKVIIDQNDNYTRQTYRNRTTIMAANGPMNLIIPVIKPKEKTKTKDIKISYDTNWQKNHRKSIESAYNNSPFFEYYKDELEIIFKKKWKFLTDLNTTLFGLIVEMLEADINVEYAENYIDTVPDNWTDLRKTIHPKKDYRIYDKLFSPVPYRQVFSETMAFVPNLSIIDLVFNKGPEAYSVLEKSFADK